MKTNILFFLSLFLAFTKASAQDANADFTNRMDYIFQYVDRSKVATGLLMQIRNNQILEVPFIDDS